MENAAKTEMSKPAVRLQGISRDFFDGKTLRRVLKDITLEIYPGELTVIAGPSGSGKTTLLTIMGLVLKPSLGTIYVEKQDAAKASEDARATLRLKKFGFVFQQAGLVPALSAEDNILIAHAIQGSSVTKTLKAKAQTLLENFGLGKLSHVKPQQLSGGEKQRVAIARAMINDPILLLCDEPTSALDIENSTLVLDTLKAISKDRARGVVLISHDSRIFPYADRLVKMENGEIVYDSRARKEEEKFP